MDYKPSWDLTTVPDPELHKEVGRRRRAHGPAVTNEKLKPCDHCSTPLNATQRRKPCPGCGYVHPRTPAK
jgi:hypothetical protein